MNNIAIVTDKPYVYKLAYENGIVFYIGKGTNGRINDHENEAKREDVKTYNQRKNRIIRKIWKNGENFVKTIIAYFDTDEEALSYEMALIFFMRPYGKLANVTDGGEGIRGYMFNEKSRRKMSERHKGTKKGPVSKETRQRLSEANKGKTHSEKARDKMSKAKKGYIPSEEHRRKIGEARTGRIHSEETKQKLSKAHKGKTLSEAHRAKLSESSKAKRKPLSEETRRKISKANTGKTHSEETRHKLSEANKGKTLSEETKNKTSSSLTKHFKNNALGYTFHKGWYEVRRRIDGKAKYLGRYLTAEEAHNAYLASFE